MEALPAPRIERGGLALLGHGEAVLAEQARCRRDAAAGLDLGDRSLLRAARDLEDDLGATRGLLAGDGALVDDLAHRDVLGGDRLLSHPEAVAFEEAAGVVDLGPDHVGDRDQLGPGAHLEGDRGALVGLEAADGGLTLRYVTNAPAVGAETPRDALARRLVETAEKEIWNGNTVIGPHRDDIAFDLGGRDLAGFASRGQQRTAILAFKSAELDLLTALDGRPPLLLLDDVFSELDPERRAHLVRRIAELPQAFVTTTTLDDLDPGLRAVATTWRVRTSPDGAELLEGSTTGPAA